MNLGTRRATGKLAAGLDEMQKLLRRCPTPAGTLRSLPMDGKELERHCRSRGCTEPHCRHRFFPCRRRVELEQGTSPLSLSARTALVTVRRRWRNRGREILASGVGEKKQRRYGGDEAELGVHETAGEAQPEASFSTISPPVFDEDNYQIWAVRMETYLDALDLWEALDVDYEIPVLPANPTMAQIKVHKEKKTKKSKAKACLFAAVSATIFSRIMSLQTAKEIWDYLKSKYEGDERIRGMQVLNLIRDFEMQKMKKTETIKEYVDRLLAIANRVRLLGSSLTDSRIVEKILVTLPERFEATITTFENTKDLTRITLAELLNALQAQ
ncbi:hypothetical protein ZIOFF_002876 [Zingiber officinale]|uniref:DUF4219 domain-containing protein n=1 Tax=Zingiber officinale TaxID=94328 RepID=A0A8J5LT14_ZINOF|nr:hypothetical protein ZIOFF_002876 [Zingiber officinale]